MPLPTRARAAPSVPKKTCQAHHAHPSREVTAISGRRDSNGPPENRAEEVERLQHHEEVEDVRHALVGDGRQPEQREGQLVEGVARPQGEYAAPSASVCGRSTSRS